MSVIALNVPTDIVWERICVTEDMMDPHACDSDMPPKWQTSMALFKYTPKDEYQLYEKRRIVYYKLVATIGSYQPEADEIEGAIDWSRVHVQDVHDFQERLKSYLPCHGALIQVTAAPPKTHGVAIRDYPYFLDCQPKQRALYEQATDYNERSSRSLESVNVTKGGGSSESQEVLDIDQGKAIGGNVSVFGTGAGFNVDDRYQAGSRRIGQTQSTDLRTSDSSREARETLSHTTQITQMYNLLQAYHLGTNRLMFYMVPRPHLLEEPSGFIRGPRLIDGIQEFFMVVSVDKDQPDPCLGVRIDTAHLTKEPVYEYARDQRPVEIRIDLDAPPPEERAPDKVSVEGGGAFYDCFELQRSDLKTETAPTGYIIEEDLIEVLNNDMKNSVGGSYELSANKASITVRGATFGHRCFRNGAGDTANTAALAGAGAEVGGFLGGAIGAVASGLGADAPGFPDKKEDSPGHLHYAIRVPFRSEFKTQWVRDDWVLKVTSRGLCCCDQTYWNRMIAVRPFDMDGILRALRTDDREARPRLTGDLFTPREINFVHEKAFEMTRQISGSIARPEKIKGVDAAYMTSRLMQGAAATPNRARWLGRPASEAFSGHKLKLHTVAEMLGRKIDQLTVHDIATAPDEVLRRAAKTDKIDLTSLRLAALGFPTRRTSPK